MKLINVTATLSHYVSYWPPSILSICCAQIHFIFSFRKTFYSNSSPGSPLNLNHMLSLGHETNCFTSDTLPKASHSVFAESRYAIRDSLSGLLFNIHSPLPSR